MKKHIFLISLITLFFSSTFPGFGHSSTVTDWQEQLDLAFYSDVHPSYFLIVDKSKQQLHLFQQTEAVRLLKTFVCATGENPGTKKISGDSKTPVGLYFITEVHEDDKITVFGSRAYHLDYPNVFDRHAGHLGNGIYIHGTNKRLVPYSTNGCISLANPDLDELAPYLTVDDIPVIVMEKFTTPLSGTALKITKNDPRFNLVLRKLSISSGDSATKNIEALSFLSLGSKAVASISYMIYGDNSLRYRFKKRTYLSLTGDQKWHTLYAVESQDTAPTILAMHPIKNHYPAVDLAITPDPAIVPASAIAADITPEVSKDTARDTAANVATNAVAMHSMNDIQPIDVKNADITPVAIQVAMGEELLDFVDKWRTAWSSKDINTYIDCYSPTFKSGRFDRKSWRKKKSYLNKKYAYIQVAIHDIAIEWTDTGANVSFFQEYKSDQYETSGTKLLQLVNRDNRWMIQREIM